MKRMISLVILLLFCLPFSSVAQSKQSGDQLLGVYWVPKPNSHLATKVRVYRTAKGEYEGRVIWFNEPNHKDGTPKLDRYNPDPKLRNQRADQAVILRGFTYNPQTKEWVGGEVYNPEDGRSYRCKLKFHDDKTLRVRGYVGVPLLGRTLYWKKLE
ncbi:MAG TPA: DUF2147 domain-containing protein [Bacteroidales bacterium]|nr:DUF2147 domain-containing protein [Bacteroidales bacterium]HOH22866.1 DUF2147 domain-containing protein [Bacteroidales bacterium]HPB57680.1 DUF2147 domain-containing protein [Bacteroidales bacterium]HPZ03973.1 DUF2147 domain-containing protein [Bacteroidales bacterium]HQB75608.1 DUF2147 domain-containing protein [Bacteroidales bacterium]